MNSHRDSEQKPIVVVSQCLGFGAVRYNGLMVENSFIAALEKHVRFVPVCPEVGIGLGVPRDPIRIVTLKSARRLIQPSTASDLTERMSAFADSFLRGIAEVDGFILKSRSPSCGVHDVKLFASATAEDSDGKGSGLFAERVLRDFPFAAVESEARLGDFRCRHNFLIKLFTLQRLRSAMTSPTDRELVRFHKAHRLLLRLFDAEAATALDAKFEDFLAKNPPRYAGEVLRVLSLVPRDWRRRFEELLKSVRDEFPAELLGNLTRGLHASAHAGHFDVIEFLHRARSMLFHRKQAPLGCEVLFEPYPVALLNWRERFPAQPQRSSHPQLIRHGE